MELWLITLAVSSLIAAMFVGQWIKDRNKPFSLSSVANPKVLYNAIQTPDGTILESLSRHDYREYTDKNGHSYMVDGGNEYLRRSLLNKESLYAYKDLSVTTDSSHDLVREHFTWGTHGKEQDKPLKGVKLKDLSNDHITAIIEEGHAIRNGHIVSKMFQDEVHWREDFDIFIEDN